jgi:single-stranded DNA-binding protein
VAIAGEAVVPTLDDSQAPVLEAAAAEPVLSEPATPPEKAVEAPAVTDANLSRNAVELVGTLESVTPGQRPGQPTRLAVTVTNGEYRDTIPVSAFQEAGVAAQDFKPGDRVEIDGYLGSFKSTRDGQTRTSSGVTANAIEAASEDQPDRNFARVAGNIAQEPNFRDGDRAYAALSLALGGDKYADVVTYGTRASDVRDTLGKGDGIAVEGRVQPREGRDGFPASVRVVGSDIELERKTEPKLELEGRLARDPQVSQGPRATRVAFSVAIDESVDGEEKISYRNVVSFDKSLATLKKGDEVSVTGRAESSTYTKDGEERTFQYVRASRVDLVQRELAEENVVPNGVAQAAPDVSTSIEEAVSTAAPDAVKLEPSAIDQPQTPAIEAGGQAAQTGPPEQPAVNLDALARQIARTDWDHEFSDDFRVWERGRAQVAETYKAVEEAAQLDPAGTSELIDQISAQIGDDRPGLVNALRAAVHRGVEQRGQARPADLSSLPSFQPGANEIVDRRENFNLAIDQTMTVLGRSEDGSRVFGRDGGGILSVSKDVFEVSPKVDEQVRISRGVDGKDKAQPVAQEVALER